MKSQKTLLAALGLLALGTTISQAEITIETVTVGDPGNAADPTTGYGSVGYSYNIGKYEVTIGQYTAFLNAVAATDTYSLYNTNMGTDLNVAGISRSGTSGSYTYSVMNNGGDSANPPITYVSWFDAARFSNWMANGQGNGSTENGAYTLNGAMSGTDFTRNLVNPVTQGEVRWWIPSENEWYKSAYYSPGASTDSYWLYPTQSDSKPGSTLGSGANQVNYNWSTGGEPYISAVGEYSGSASHSGTYDQGGNVWEWNDAVIDGYTYGSDRGLRGGSWGTNNYWSDSYLGSSYRGSSTPFIEYKEYGFRIASVPEPSTYALLAIGLSTLLLASRRAPARC